MGQGVGVEMAVLKYCTYVKINSPLAGWLWGARQGKKGSKGERGRVDLLVLACM